MGTRAIVGHLCVQIKPGKTLSHQCKGTSRTPLQWVQFAHLGWRPALTSGTTPWVPQGLGLSKRGSNCKATSRLARDIVLNLSGLNTTKNRNESPSDVASNQVGQTLEKARALVHTYHTMHKLSVKSQISNLIWINTELILQLSNTEGTQVVQEYESGVSECDEFTNYKQGHS